MTPDGCVCTILPMTNGRKRVEVTIEAYAENTEVKLDEGEVRVKIRGLFPDHDVDWSNTFYGSMESTLQKSTRMVQRIVGDVWAADRIALLQAERMDA